MREERKGAVGDGTIRIMRKVRITKRWQAMRLGWMTTMVMRRE